MGNCQASEVATVVIQHPGGRVERLYWPTSAADVMKTNPGYHVALVSLYVSEEKQDGSSVRFTRVKLLKPKDMLLLGQVYRLITSQEVTKALRQRKYEKIRKSQAELIRKQQQEHRTKDQDGEANLEDSRSRHQATKQGSDRQKSSIQMAVRGRQWRPSLQSISEMGS
ncbi:uncharacterized protein LOC103999264 [Musa acuminata AAA Group]|uniref:Uncharacterized protein n=1 Tax=Musa acuminata subsp. malaccensis TaxID=214687 RepID=A0A804KPU4_MUSAM|nr:PREDICTED: uncharacterized protein LOC103999264 [Musa acuminata subsp. malaccensis]